MCIRDRVKFDDDESEAIRQRMEAIQAEMNTVIDEMAEMESRLLAQQEALEAQQPKLPYASSETTGRKTSNRKRTEPTAQMGRPETARMAHPDPSSSRRERRTSSAISRTDSTLTNPVSYTRPKTRNMQHARL